MEKVKVSKEVAKAIEETLANYDRVTIVDLHVRNHAALLKGVDRDTLIRALYIGYEVEDEPTPREKAQILLQKFYGFHPMDDLMKELESIYEVEDRDHE